MVSDPNIDEQERVEFSKSRIPEGVFCGDEADNQNTVITVTTSFKNLLRMQQQSHQEQAGHELN